MSAIPPAGEEFFAWRRAEFPFFERKICLTHASVSPIPARAKAALVDYAGRLAGEGQFDYIHEPIYQRCKARLAKLIGQGARPEEIAFAGSTSHALGLVATAYPWKPGDNCVVSDGDFPANVVIWKNLEHTHGIEVRLVPGRPVMDLTVHDLAPYVDENTRMVSLSAANFLSGYPLDLKTIGAWLHDRGVLFCVDAIQMLGAVPIDASEVDFLCADGHKWLLAPNGIAVRWGRSEALARLRPMILGWLATQGRDNWFAYDTTPRAQADCFEPGARNYLGAIALEAALAVLEDYGAATVATRVAANRDYAAARLAGAGCKLLWTPEPGKGTGIVSFQKPGADMSALYKRIDERFAVSIRKDRHEATWIRISPHFMNCEQDIDELVEWMG